MANQCGVTIREVKEIAPGVIVAREGEGSFIYYFLSEVYRFRTDRTACLYCANDQAGNPGGCSENILSFVCGLNSPNDWDQVISEGSWRLERVDENEIGWFNELKDLASE